MSKRKGVIFKQNFFSKHNWIFYFHKLIFLLLRDLFQMQKFEPRRKPLADSSIAFLYLFI